MTSVFKGIPRWMNLTWGKRIIIEKSGRGPVLLKETFLYRSLSGS
jgi:hypothetical protein